MRIVCVFTTYIMRIYFVYYKIYKITKRTGKLRILFGQNVNCKSILNNIQYIHSKQTTK
jgi:hypothetical protein